MSSDWKTIRYRGGLVEFRVPRSWVEEYGEDGEGAFYDPTPDSDTLRLSVLTFRRPSSVDSETPLDLLRPRSERRGVALERLPNGNALISYSAPAEEDGIALVLHHWEVANAVPPAHARIAVFSFTTRVSQAAGAPASLRWIDEEIRQARFSAELGILGGG
jgi:hypothetical protein